MRFKIDENLPVEAAIEFRREGHEADTVLDEGLAGTSDAQLAGQVRRERRVLVSLDVDFGNLKRYPPAEFAGIVVFRIRNQGKRSVLAAVARVLLWSQSEAIDGKLLILDETSIRVHD